MHLTNSIRTTFDRSLSHTKADCCEKFANATLFFMRHGIGYQKYALIDNKTPVQLKTVALCISRFAATVFAFLVALPLTLLGLAFLPLSKTHRNAYAALKKHHIAPMNLPAVPQKPATPTPPAATTITPPAVPVAPVVPKPEPVKTTAPATPLKIDTALPANPPAPPKVATPKGSPIIAPAQNQKAISPLQSPSNLPLVAAPDVSKNAQLQHINLNPPGGAQASPAVTPPVVSPAQSPIPSPGASPKLVAIAAEEPPTVPAKPPVNLPAAATKPVSPTAAGGITPPVATALKVVTASQPLVSPSNPVLSPAKSPLTSPLPSPLAASSKIKKNGDLELDSLAAIKNADKDLTNKALKTISLNVDNFNEDELVEGLKHIIAMLQRRLKAPRDKLECTLKFNSKKPALKLPTDLLVKFSEAEGRVLHKLVKNDPTIIRKFILGISIPNRDNNTVEQLSCIQKSQSLSEKQKCLLLGYIVRLYIDPTIPHKALLSFSEELLKELSSAEFNIILGKLYEKSASTSAVKQCLKDMLKCAQATHSITSSVQFLEQHFPELFEDDDFFNDVAGLLTDKPAEWSAYLLGLNEKQFDAVLVRYKVTTDANACQAICAALTEGINFTADLTPVITKFNQVVSKTPMGSSEAFKNFPNLLVISSLASSLEILKDSMGMKLTVEDKSSVIESSLKELSEILLKNNVSAEKVFGSHLAKLRPDSEIETIVAIFNGFDKARANKTNDFKEIICAFLNQVLHEKPDSIQNIFKIFFGRFSVLDHAAIQEIFAALLPAIKTKETLKALVQALKDSVDLANINMGHAHTMHPIENAVKDLIMNLLRKGKHQGTKIGIKDDYSECLV